MVALYERMWCWCCILYTPLCLVSMCAGGALKKTYLPTCLFFGDFGDFEVFVLAPRAENDQTRDKKNWGGEWGRGGEHRFFVKRFPPRFRCIFLCVILLFKKRKTGLHCTIVYVHVAFLFVFFRAPRSISAPIDIV
jgi:hypothetical protein